MTDWTREEQKDHRKLWINALRSGNYKQGKYRLRSVDNKYCCLGVACEVAFQNGVQLQIRHHFHLYFYDENDGYPPMIVRDFFGLITEAGDYVQDNNLSSLSTDNDTLNYNFDEIANIIESEPCGLFK